MENVNLIFKVWREKRIKDILIPGSKRFNDFDSNGSVHAIRDMNLLIQDGERLAIIGHNGAGKSSFLKMVSGIYPPVSGKLTVDGRISSMFELSTGFEMEQNGWDNIYLRGLMLGETPISIKKKMREIAEFSELGEFLNMPVKYYSSGMFVRLAFSVSTAIIPDILLLDEVVAAGDAEFLNKATQRMNKMMEISKIMVLVTHSMKSAIEMCNRCIWLERGMILMDGDPQTVVNAYMNSTI
ncbi:ABC transporter ATP-binding protein [Desulfosporosinus sp. SB140]|uniref:ABC transporter ATP-binding protein n=1 Tax=Desulfosporosinus paludis TaxID=3115649 RepID=UPI00388D801E